MEKLYFNIKFIALTPIESTAQIEWDGTKQGAYDALVNELTGMYGPQNFKITLFEETDSIDEEHTVEIGKSPPNSKVTH